MRSIIALGLALLLQLQGALAFLPPTPRAGAPSPLLSSSSRRAAAAAAVARLYAAADGRNGEGGGKRELDRLFEEMEKANSKSSMGSAIKETVERLPLPSIDVTAVKPDPSRPFRFPAYGFLLLSALLGISFTGSLTELATGHPLFGQAATLAIVAVAGPGFIGTFVVAVNRYNEEREEDNRRLEEEERRQEAEREAALQGPVMMPDREKLLEDLTEKK